MNQARVCVVAVELALAALSSLLAACDKPATDGAAPRDGAGAAAPAPAAIAAPGPATAPTAAPPAAGGSQRVAIVDAQGFGQPINAATLEIPAGWRADGGVSWQRADPCVNNQLRIAWVARAPDGRQAFEVMHPYSWQLQGRSVPMNPCPVLPFASARDFLQAVAQQRRAGARVLDYRDRPDVRADAEAKAPPPAAGVRRQIDAGELLVAYPAPDAGGEVQERFSTSVTFTEVQGTVMGGAGIVYAQRQLGGTPDAAQYSEKSLASSTHWPLSQWNSPVASEQLTRGKKRPRHAAGRAIVSGSEPSFQPLPSVGTVPQVPGCAPTGARVSQNSPVAQSALLLQAVAVWVTVPFTGT